MNSSCPSEAIWQLGSRSTLAPAMACCLTAPGRYLNQSWISITKARMYLATTISQKLFHICITDYNKVFENNYFETMLYLPVWGPINQLSLSIMKGQWYCLWQMIKVETYDCRCLTVYLNVCSSLIIVCRASFTNTFPVKCGMKLLIHSQTSTVAPLKFGIGHVISSYILWWMWLFIHAGNKVNLC